MNTILTPIDLSAATKVTPRLWRKQVLPEGSINYKGERIDLSPERLRAMESAFHASAFDSVPLVLADAQNRHTMDPRAATGRVVDAEYVPGHGLDLLVRPNEEAEQLLANNPDVGVSARIVMDYDRADGEHFDAAIQHALITWDPRITGMTPWQVVGLSNESEHVLDLSEYQFVARSGDANPKEIPVGKEDEPLFTKEDVAALKGLLALIRDGQHDEPESHADEPDEAETDELDEGESDEGEADEGEADEVTDEELERIAAEALAELEADDEPQLVTAANEGGEALELANARLDEQAVELANMREKLDEAAFEKEQAKFADEFGIPPHITELARPLLQGQHVLNLANGDELDAGKVMRDVLAAVGKQVQLLDLSGAVGDSFGAEPDTTSPEARAAQAKADREFLGI